MEQQQHAFETRQPQQNSCLLLKHCIEIITNNTTMATGNSSRIHHFKLVLLGDTAVGKSCLVVRFVRDEFFEFQEPTIGGTTRT